MRAVIPIATALIVAALAAGGATKTPPSERSMQDAAASAANQRASAQSNDNQALIRSTDGAALYHAYCAACHGRSGKGDGPVAPSLRATVPDLTIIAKLNGGEFPTARVRRIILGEGMIASHGTREMPIWGPIFHQVEADVDRGNIRVDNLVKYLESIQAIGAAYQKPDNKIPTENEKSGAQLYKQLCATCHGNDLKGSGPAPYPFKGVPPDLSTLARRHGGRFPDAYFADVLRNGVRMPAHGPAEMPIWGSDFRAGEGLNEAQVNQRIASLSLYVKAHQE
jgi:mono/diheme cytochrome c family protein